jgi:hypothetical protein
MRVAVTQPTFLPWLGYFELIDQVDFFVVLDNVQLARRSFMVRNRVFSHTGDVRWLTEEIQKCSQKTPMTCAYLSMAHPWWESLYNRIAMSYGRTPYWNQVSSIIPHVLKPKINDSVATYNWRTILGLCELIGLNMKGRWQMSSSMGLVHDDVEPQQRILDICKFIGATEFFNFRKGIEIGLYAPERFEAEGITLWKQDYQHPIYPQHRSGDFVPYLSVIDLLCCVGPESVLEIIRQGRRWERVK